MDTKKIAVVTEDGQRVSSHFGMAPRYQVFTVADGQILSQEERLKPHHVQHPQHEGQHGAAGHAANHVGFHADMLAPVSDCQVLLCGGMGQPAYQKAQAAGLEVVLAGGDISSTLQAYLNGQLTSDMRRVHQK